MASNQVTALIRYLKTNPDGKRLGITAGGAVEQLGIMSLTKRVSELERMGYKFKREKKQLVNRYGNPTTVMWYKLEKEPYHHA